MATLGDYLIGCLQLIVSVILNIVTLVLYLVFGLLSVFKGGKKLRPNVSRRPIVLPAAAL